MNVSAMIPVVLLLLPCYAGEWKSKGEVTIESRAFSDDDNDETVDENLGAFSRLDLSYKHKGFRFRLRGFGRIDDRDPSRDLTSFEETWLGYKKNGWDVRAGWQMLNWTATEAFHPADTLNSRNLDSDIENPEKLGELMLSVRRRINNGGLTLYYMPRFEEPGLPEYSSRLSFLPFPLELGPANWVDDDGIHRKDNVDQWGLRFTQTIGDADLSVHYLDHVDRQQPSIYTGTLVGANTNESFPLYFQVEEYGITYLHVLGGLIVKLEATRKEFTDYQVELANNPADHSQVALGFEYVLSHQNGRETTLILEGQGLFDATEEERAGLSIFQRDVLIGVRHAFNDVAGREILFTAIYDVERSHEYLINLRYQQRLSDTWSIRTGLRYVDAPLKASPFPQGLQNLDEANQVYLNVSRYF